jgi:excinuclease ABC subunit C
MAPDKIKEILRRLPDKPGIYKYFDSSGTIIYVGKAKSLKKRVSSYFNKQQHENRKTDVLVRKIDFIDFTVVDTEMDALLLENSLIKEFQPRYNINLKDDKSYPFIRVTNERFPKVFAMRNPVRDGSEYFGPYASPRAMHAVLELARSLYPTRNCNLAMTPENIQAGKFKICLEYQIGNCLGPCEGKQSEQDYNESIENIRHLLKGHLGEVKRNIKQQMQTAASELKFELAQQLKEKLNVLEKYQHRSTIVSPLNGNIEVFSISSSDKYAFVNHLRVAEGLIIGSRNLEIRKKMEETDAELLEFSINEVRSEYGASFFSQLVVPFIGDFTIDGLEMTVPKMGDKKKLLDLSLKNAMLFRQEKINQYEKLNPELKVDRLMEKMKADLRLTDQPKHIECFDNSNFQGSYPVSACVVFRDGKPAKSDYRHFNIKTVEGPNDFATMQEVLTRRYSRMLDEQKSLPQLVVVDGGKGQLSAAVEAFRQLGIYGKVALIGIAKRLEEIYFPDDPLPLYIDKKSETLKVIQQMRDEAHRFGITHHRKRRDKSTLESELVDIKGIGEDSATALLKHFKSLKKIKEASVEALAEVVGTARAKLVFENYQTSNAS